jgi:signal transduction histidine kinase
MEDVARACHEVRGPLTAARLGLSSSLRAGLLSPARARALDQQLERAARAIADLEHTQRGSVAVAVEPGIVDVDGLVLDSIAAWWASAEARGTVLQHARLGPPARVRGDRVRLAQALGNLIANALEHGSGPVRVRCSNDGEAVRVEVQDSGPGLRAPVGELARRRRGRGARGRGLAIASSIVTAHGGRLSSAPSESGARIVMALPHMSEARSAETSRS